MMATRKDAHAARVKHKANVEGQKNDYSNRTIALSNLLKILLLLRVLKWTMQIVCFIFIHFCLINVLFNELKTYLWLCADRVKYVFPSHLDAMNIPLWCDVMQVFKMTKHHIIITTVPLQNAYWLPFGGKKMCVGFFPLEFELSYFHL